MSINKRCAISSWRSGLESAGVSCAFTLWEPNNTVTLAEDNNRGATATDAALLRRERRNNFFEARIIPKRIEHRIEPELRRSERNAPSQCALIRKRQKFV